jgi:hypothetical protein
MLSRINKFSTPLQSHKPGFQVKFSKRKLKMFLCWIALDRNLEKTKSRIKKNLCEKKKLKRCRKYSMNFSYNAALLKKLIKLIVVQTCANLVTSEPNFMKIL